jgi:beta-glucanase (GH16 family)
VLGTLHYGASWPDNTHTGADYVLPRGGSIADFHIYAVEWEPGRIRWFVDDVQTQEQRFWWSTTSRAGAVAPRAADLNPWPAPFDQRFYLVMNLAVGGNFLGNPDATTPFPGVMEVDFVRVYQRRDRSTRPWSRGAGRFPWSRAKGG